MDELVPDPRAAERLAEATEQTVAAGPFAVTLEQVWSFGGLMPRFEVHAPKVPSLEQSLSGLEFVLDEIHLRNGIVHRPPAPSAHPWCRPRRVTVRISLHDRASVATGSVPGRDRRGAESGVR